MNSQTLDFRLAHFVVAYSQAMLENLVLGKVFQLLKICGRAIQGSSRNQPDNLSAYNFYSDSFSLPAHRFVGSSNPSDFVVHDVHRNLRQPARAQLKAERFQERQTAVTCAHRSRDVSSDRNVRGAQVDVEGNQKRTRANCDCTGCFMNAQRDNIAMAIGIPGDLFAK